MRPNNTPVPFSVPFSAPFSVAVTCNLVSSRVTSIHMATTTNRINPQSQQHRQPINLLPPTSKGRTSFASWNTCIQTTRDTCRQRKRRTSQQASEPTSDGLLGVVAGNRVSRLGEPQKQRTGLPVRHVRQESLVLGLHKRKQRGRQREKPARRVSFVNPAKLSAGASSTHTKRQLAKLDPRLLLLFQQ